MTPLQRSKTENADVERRYAKQLMREVAQIWNLSAAELIVLCLECVADNNHIHWEVPRIAEYAHFCVERYTHYKRFIDFCSAGKLAKLDMVQKILQEEDV